MSAQRNSMPAVFHFQPTDIKVVESPDGLKRWEQMMRENVGIKVQNFELVSGTCTLSCVGDADGHRYPSDCDLD